jgi:hypothetical protein
LSDSSSTVKWIALAAAVAVCAAIPLGLLLWGDEPSARSSPAAGPAPQRPAERPAPDRADAAAQGSASQGDPDLNASIDAFLDKVPVAPFPRPGQVLKEARDHPEALGPIDYRVKLEKALRYQGGPVEGVHMLVGMKGDSEVMRFQTAMALSKHLDPESTRLLLSEVRTADEAVRPDLVFALRGSPAPEVNQAFVDLYATDANPKVRAQAAFAIGERGERIDPLEAERARQRARDDIHSDDPDTVKAASDVLGVPPLSPEDRSMLERILASDPDEDRRLSAFRALATAKVPPTELAPILEQVAADAGAGERLRGMAKQVLEQLQSPEPAPGEGR